MVERTKGLSNEITVEYSTTALAGMMKEGGILLHPAIEGIDYVRTSGVLKFTPDQVSLL